MQQTNIVGTVIKTFLKKKTDIVNYIFLFIYFMFFNTSLYQIIFLSLSFLI